ncbi:MULTISPECIES: NACHT domain-containing NTPase [Pectobacterium]|uniref:NACHT domain-containing protein n=1 Tax=Pectobacterium TaxID=122277 RepID=UPI0016519CDB|nr:MULTISPECIES: NACHT domain-containing protein [Pectobacterium]UPY96923.1 NACHT domain-containing protein [Pectobacterium sp. 21LCBS03]GKV98882.1 hypothetical protein PEC301653_19280 [Pectobacterium carotovorum subsp. carotovorum]
MLSEILITTTVKSIAKKLIDAGVGAIKWQSNKILQALTNDKILDHYAQNAVNRVFVFRTLIHGDKNVYLDEVYYPLKLKHNDGNLSIEVTEKTKLPTHSPVCIVGIAGQGKTTVMRKLFLEELIRKESLPFFISLRQVKDYESLSCEELLHKHLILNGIDCEIKDVIYLCKSKKISFYFDGFDEIPFSQRVFALDTINKIYECYRCPVTVTTRPETEITRSAGYDTYHVNFLNRDDILAILENTVTDADAHDFIINLLESKDFLMESIRTPILLDIFVITSTALREDPNSISDYYDGLFTALLHRHDLIKNLTRVKKSNLPDRILEKCFSLFSFFSLMNSKGDFSRAEINELFAKSATALKVEKLPEDIADDIIGGTNILVKDGYDNYVYIHKSIQEYFAAKCVSTMDDSAKENIYNNYSKMESYQLGSSFMLMLSYLDSFSFIKLYIFEVLDQAQCLKDNLIITLPKKDFVHHLELWILEIDLENIGCFSLAAQRIGPWKQIHEIERISTYISTTRFEHSLDILGHNIMMVNGGKVARLVRNGIIKPLPKDDPRNKKLINKGSLNVIIEISSTKRYIDDYDAIFEKAYENYTSSVHIINKYIKEYYHNKIESNNILNCMIDKIKFK